MARGPDDAACAGARRGGSAQGDAIGARCPRGAVARLEVRRCVARRCEAPMATRSARSVRRRYQGRPTRAQAWRDWMRRSGARSWSTGGVALAPRRRRRITALGASGWMKSRL
uniref:Uncharacterized protein n=1 Tax=Arundo donax TaxID=35708 RepID=A0A0A9EKH3_ARUDO